MKQLSTLLFILAFVAALTFQATAKGQLSQNSAKPEVRWYSPVEVAKSTDLENKILLFTIHPTSCEDCTEQEKKVLNDPEIINLIETNFIPIKVTGAERPDLEKVFKQMLKVRDQMEGNRLITVLALPDGRPFWVNNLSDKDQWEEALTFFIKEYANNPKSMEEIATQITNSINNQEIAPSSSMPPSQNGLNNLSQKLLSNMDKNYGGLKEEFKHPQPHNYIFLLNNYFHNNDKETYDVVIKTLDKMSMGGIYDHLEGGFFQYAKDENWNVPNFRKSLYLNGQMVSLYTKAYQLTKNPEYKKIVYRTIKFIENKLMTNQGAFYAGIGIGEENDYYTWTEGDILQVIRDDKEAKIVLDYFNIGDAGTYVPNSNQTKTLTAKYNVSEEQLYNIITKAEKSLLANRENRPQPETDKKVITAWNAVMLKGLIDAYSAFGDDRFLEMALLNANYLSKNSMKVYGRIWRTTDVNMQEGFLEDYALLSEAFISLYQVTFNERWLYMSKSITDYTIKNFYDEASSSFFFTSSPLNNALKLETRVTDFEDKITPSSNSIMANVLYLQSIFFHKKAYKKKAESMLNRIQKEMEQSDEPHLYTNWSTVYSYFIEAPYEVAILGENSAAMRQQLSYNFFPNVLFYGGRTEGTLEALQGKMVDGMTMIYVCQNSMCKMPTTEVDEAVALILE